MTGSDLAHLELLAEVDSLREELDAWASRAPDWPAAHACRALIARLAQRADWLRLRLEAPLVVATLGGTGTGKSTLVNAIVGEEVTQASRQRPTTRKPVMICRPGLSSEDLGIDPQDVTLVQRESPALRDLVLIDCPDPDTTEDTEDQATNLARLRHLLPHCDVLLVTSTQQKYRSARVTAELAAAAKGARLVFVQTHADRDQDVRQDWAAHLEGDYALGEMFFIDSLSALSDAQGDLVPRGEFARLMDLLTRELAGTAAHRIRRANFLDLVEETLAACRRRLTEDLPPVEALDAAIAEQRGRLSARLAHQMRSELLSNRRYWETRLLGEVASRWGYSPFALVLRAFQGLGGLLSSSVLFRARTPAQLALWGMMEGGRQLTRRQRKKSAEGSWSRAVSWSWDEAELRTAAIIIDGYAGEAGLQRDSSAEDSINQQAAAAGEQFITTAAAEIQTLIGKQAGRHTGWFTRLRYELALLAMLGVLFFRVGKNFFYDSWLAPLLGHANESARLFGFDFFVQAVFWLLLWCAVLLWFFTGRLRRGLKGQIRNLAQHWGNTSLAKELLADLDSQTRAIHRFTADRARLESTTAALKHKLTKPSHQLGHRIGQS